MNTIIQTNYDTQSLVYFPVVSQMDGSGIYAAVVAAGVSATRVLWGTRSLYLVHRQSLWGSLRFQQQECFQTVTERSEYQCLVNTQHPCLCSDSPNGTEYHPSHWERNCCYIVVTNADPDLVLHLPRALLIGSYGDASWLSKNCCL